MSGDLSALVARLEAVTTRLESAADRAGGGESAGLKKSLTYGFTSHGNFSFGSLCVETFNSLN